MEDTELLLEKMLKNYNPCTIFMRDNCDNYFEHRRKFVELFTEFVIRFGENVLYISFGKSNQLMYNDYLSCRFDLTRDYYKNPKEMLTETQKHLITHHTPPFVSINIPSQNLELTIDIINQLNQFKFVFVDNAMSHNKDRIDFIQRLCDVADANNVRVFVHLNSRTIDITKIKNDNSKIIFI